MVKIKNSEFSLMANHEVSSSWQTQDGAGGWFWSGKCTFSMKYKLWSRWEASGLHCPQSQTAATFRKVSCVSLQKNPSLSTFLHGRQWRGSLDLHLRIQPCLSTSCTDLCPNSMRFGEGARECRLGRGEEGSLSADMRKSSMLGKIFQWLL